MLNVVVMGATGIQLGPKVKEGQRVFRSGPKTLKSKGQRIKKKNTGQI